MEALDGSRGHTNIDMDMFSNSVRVHLHLLRSTEPF